LLCRPPCLSFRRVILSSLALKWPHLSLDVQVVCSCRHPRHGRPALRGRVFSRAGGPAGRSSGACEARGWRAGPVDTRGSVTHWRHGRSSAVLCGKGGGQVHHNDPRAYHPTCLCALIPRPPVACSAPQLRSRAAVARPVGKVSSLRMQGGEKGPMHDAIDKVSRHR
jgi:hypothetical protein